MKPNRPLIFGVALVSVAAIVFVANRSQQSVISVGPIKSSARPRQSLMPTLPARQLDGSARQASALDGDNAFEPSSRDVAESNAEKSIYLAHAAEFDEIEKLSDDKRRRMLRELFKKWVLEDAPEAANFVLSVENQDMRKEAMLQLMQAWAAHDSTAALTWAKDAAFDNSYERDVAMSMACTEAANVDVVKAINLALEYEVGNHGELLEGLAAKWTDSDPAAASNWALAQPDGERRNRLVAAISLEMFNKDPGAATRFVLDEIPAGKDQDNAIFALVVRFSSFDLNKAMTWVKSFPPGSLKSQAIGYLRGVSDPRQN